MLWTKPQPTAEVQAAYASPIIMMSQNRQVKLNDRRNQLDLQINLLAEQENTEMLELLRLLCAKAGIRIDQEPRGKSFGEATSPAEVVREIEGADPASVVRRLRECRKV